MENSRDSQESTLSITPAERGDRLRKLRESLKLSRQIFGDRYGISPRSIQNWESARYGGLTHKGARKIVEGLKQDHIICSVDWLYLGFGYAPHGLNLEHQPRVAEPKMGIARELSFYHQLNPGSTDLVMPDDSMKPAFYKGDCLAGYRYYEGDLEYVIGLPCIVQLEDGSQLVRCVLKGEQTDTYHLEAYQTDIAPIKNIKIFSAAPVLWIRRHFPHH